MLAAAHHHHAQDRQGKMSHESSLLSKLAYLAFLGMQKFIKCNDLAISLVFLVGAAGLVPNRACILILYPLLIFCRPSLLASLPTPFGEY